jgi:hypothetical protein
VEILNNLRAIGNAGEKVNGRIQPSISKEVSTSFLHFLLDLFPT